MDGWMDGRGAWFSSAAATAAHADTPTQHTCIRPLNNSKQALPQIDAWLVELETDQWTLRQFIEANFDEVAFWHAHAVPQVVAHHDMVLRTDEIDDFIVRGEVEVGVPISASDNNQ